MSDELPIIQKTYDLIKWMVPILDRLPRTHRFTLGNRIIEELYDLLESLISVRYAKAGRLSVLQSPGSHALPGYRSNAALPLTRGGASSAHSHAEHGNEK